MPANDKFKWIAHYNDGSQLKQIESDGSKNAYGDIDRSRLESFELVHRDSNEHVFAMPFEDNQKLIWRRRTDASSGMVVHVVGKKETVDGKRYDGIAAVFQDGSVEVSDRWDDNHPWFANIVPHPEEGE